MQIGAWKSFHELEENMTLDELVELYASILETRTEEFKNMARANGAKFKEDEPDEDAFNRVLDQVKSRSGEQQEDEKKTLGIFSINSI